MRFGVMVRNLNTMQLCKMADAIHKYIMPNGKVTIEETHHVFAPFDLNVNTIWISGSKNEYLPYKGYLLDAFLENKIPFFDHTMLAFEDNPEEMPYPLR